ncbi:spore cortex biosynthesis protein YabQ [Terrisporobacter sp.]|uniref:spore cortex biosynthesis protein YabQ n=1 Tax=Terrisporobacter sp. TaxID=1965305 RepID=UPI00260371B5|nr:spore cortex biosynthesis protein YabQ [Terrisporobacter sp.]
MGFFIEDINIFYLTLYGGIVIGLLFDFYRSLRRNFKVVRKISFLFDLIFWILITVVIFITINTLEKFDLRYYHFVALFLGFALYYYTISKYVFIVFNKIISFITSLFKKTAHYIVSFLNNLYYIIIYSIHLIFDIICYIPSVLLSNKRKRKNKKGVGI